MDDEMEYNVVLFYKKTKLCNSEDMELFCLLI